MKAVSLTTSYIAMLCALSAPQIKAQVNPTGAEATAGRQYSMSHVESNRKWKLGFNSRTYDKVATELEALLVPELTGKGWTRADGPGTGPKLVIEIVEVSQHTAAFGKQGIDMVSTITVQDTGGKQLYSKVYRGESRSAGMHTWGGMIDMAEKESVKAILDDGDLVKALDGATR